MGRAHASQPDRCGCENSLLGSEVFVCLFLNNFIYLFIFGCTGSLLLHGGLLQLQQEEGGYSPAVVCALLTAVPSLIADHGF